MDRLAVLAKLHEFRSSLKINHDLWDREPEDYYKSPAWKDNEEQIIRELPGIKRIAERVDPMLAGAIHEVTSMYSWTWSQVDKVVLTLIGSLESEEEIAGLLGPTGPLLSAEGLHPWVWGPAASLWDGGHRRASIQAASTQLDLALQGKLSRYDSGGTDLVTQAFNLAAPEPGRPRLRFPGLQPGTEIYKSAHEGAMNLGRGCFMGIRNLATHDLTEPDHQEALEFLAALSVLARWIDASKVIQSQRGVPG